MNIFPDPRADVVALLAYAFPAPTTVSTSSPASTITAEHLQVIWDGTPSEQSNRQVCAIAVIAYAPKGRVSDSIEAAQYARAFLLDSEVATTWRFRPGPGPHPEIDADTGLPRCEFTVYAETRPTAVA